MSSRVRRIEHDEGARLKRVRLAALADAPSAFGSSYDAEVSNSDQRWAELARERSSGPDHATFFAEIEGQVVGLVGGHRARPAMVELVSMWTDPVARGRGVGRALVEAVVAWAEGSTVELWVARGNDGAAELYQRCGFAVTEDHDAEPWDPCKDDIRMRREPDR